MRHAKVNQKQPQNRPPKKTSKMTIFTPFLDPQKQAQNSHYFHKKKYKINKKFIEKNKNIYKIYKKS